MGIDKIISRGLILYLFRSITRYKGIIRTISIPSLANALGKAAQTSPRPPVDANGTISLLANKIFTSLTIHKTT